MAGNAEQISTTRVRGWVHFIVRHPEATIGLVALTCRLVFIWVLYSRVSAGAALSRGSDGYEYIAQTLVQGGGYRFAADLSETMYLLPVYPLFLAGLFLLFGVSLAVVQVVQSCIDAITGILIYRIGRDQLGPQAGLAGGLIYAFYPGMWVACARYLTEPLFVFILTAFIWLFCAYLRDGTRWRLFMAGICCAIAVLCKSVAGMMPVFVIVCGLILPAWRPCRARMLGGLAVCFALVVLAAAPWVYRNDRVCGERVYPSTSGGATLYHASVCAKEPALGYRDAVYKAVSEIHGFAKANDIRLDPRDTWPRWFYRPQDELKLDRICAAEAWKNISAQPSNMVRHIASNVWRFWFGGPTRKSTLASLAINGPILLLGLAGLFLARAWRDPALALWLSVAAYLFLGHIAVMAVVRYSLTVIPMMCLFTGYTLYRFDLFRRQRAT